MLILKTMVHETIWGGEKLTSISGSSCKTIGHLYGVNCNKNTSNKILNGDYKGKTLNEYFDANKTKFGLNGYEFFPLTIALVDASEHLSIQVHPNDEDVMILDKTIRGGKNESWYFIAPPDDGYIYNGCLCTSMKELKDMIRYEQLSIVADKLAVKKGDYVYVVAGTLHVLTKGSLVYEIEENAGCTYRLYDFNRIDKNGQKRPLQISEAFYAIDTDSKSVVKNYDQKPIEERLYKTQLYENLQVYFNHSKTLQALTLIEGEFMVANFKICKGATILLEPHEKIEIYKNKIIVAEPKVKEKVNL